MLKTKKEIKTWLDYFGVNNYTIHDDLIVDVDESVFLAFLKIDEIPFQFGKVKGYFDISNNNLTSLIGSPFEVTSDANFSHNRLKSLQYCPKIIGADLLLGEHSDSFEQKGRPNEIEDLSLDDLPSSIGE